MSAARRAEVNRDRRVLAAHAGRRWLALAVLAACVAAGADAANRSAAPELNAAQIVAKNVAARGGLDAWRKVQTMIWAGHMENPTGPVQSMPFVLEQKRPNKTRFEITALNRKNVRVFDGGSGWKVRPTPEGRVDVQPYTPQELKFARDTPGIDGPLIDYEAKGSTVALDGIDKVEGRKAFRLDVRLASGERHHVWIDAETFLDLKYDRTSYSVGGTPGTVAVLYRDYRQVEGLQIPTTIEIGVGSDQKPDRMVIERIAVNPPLDDRTFSNPNPPGSKHAHAYDARGAPGGLNRPVIPAAARPAAPPPAPAPATADPGPPQQ